MKGRKDQVRPLEVILAPNLLSETTPSITPWGIRIG
jgi:hypothetical protein